MNQTLVSSGLNYGLDVRVDWASSTGNLADLTGTDIREFVDYNQDDWGIAPSYTIIELPGQGPVGSMGDHHFVGPAAVPLAPVLCCLPAKITASQAYDWDCHDGNGWRTFMNASLDRTLAGPPGARTFTTTKTGPGGPFVSAEAYSGPTTTTSLH